MRRILIASFAALLLGAPIAACHKATADAGAPAGTLPDQGAASKAWLEKNAKEPGVTTLPSGVQYKITRSGPADGPKPGLHDEVKVNYEGKLITGIVFDSSYDRGTPVSFPLDGVIPGWTDALQHMRVGDEWTLYIPSDLAYGPHPEQHGADNIPPNAALIFRVELLDILPAAGPAPAPPAPIAPAK